MKDKSTSERTYLEVFTKGIFMGLADIVPGVSGGTIALITGIYERLIFAIRSINVKFISLLLRSVVDRKYLSRAKRSFFSIDFPFLLPLVVGIVSAFLLASYVITFVLDNYPAYIYSFFFGLILISAKIVFERIEKHSFKALSFGLVGFLSAFFFVGLEGFAADHSYTLIFVSGFFGMCAMMLPGTSGSFMVLFLGQYEYLLNALHSMGSYWVDLGIFLVGALASLFSFSRVIAYSLKNYHACTLFFLSGLMVGALRLPFEEVISLPEVPHDPILQIGSIVSGLIGVAILYLSTRGDNLAGSVIFDRDHDK